ncbi:MAG: hypothetical protein ACT4QG_17255 [Sporichthyaceae bacterium]
MGAALEKAGARSRDEDCAYEASRLGVDCRSLYSYGGVDIVVLAGDASGLTQRAVPTFLSARIVTIEGPEARQLPLGDWPTLGLVPEGWAAVPCIASIEDGCLKYEGEIAGDLTMDQAADALRTTWATHGYRIDDDRCDGFLDQAGGTTPGCSFALVRYRETGGRARLQVLARLVPGPTGGYVASFATLVQGAPATPAPGTPTL